MSVMCRDIRLKKILDTSYNKYKAPLPVTGSFSVKLPYNILGFMFVPVRSVGC